MQVTLPDGAVVFAHGRLELVPVERSADPELALYLDERWRDDPVVTWPHRIVDWPDFGLPTNEAVLFDDIVDLHRRAVDGARVELACFGGIGRTGTVLSCLTVVAGIDDPGDAIRWVREHYHASAVETPEQEELVARFAGYITASPAE